MRYKKIPTFALLLAGLLPFAGANEQPNSNSTPSNATVLYSQWQQLQQKQLTQRQYFLQFENLLKNATTQNRLGEATLARLNSLLEMLADYPLKPYAELALLNAKSSAGQLDLREIEQFSLRYPQLATARQVLQLPFKALFAAGQFEPLLAYAQRVPPASLADKCRVLAAEFQLLAEKQQPNPEAEQAGTPSKMSVEMGDLLQRFDHFWRNLDHLPPKECAPLEAYWRDQGMKSAEKVRPQAVKFFQKNAKNDLEQLRANNRLAELDDWLNKTATLAEQPATLPSFIAEQPMSYENQQVIRHAFLAFLKTQPENTAKPDFNRYQAWASQWQLGQGELSEWKLAFLRHFFDNSEPEFQRWRDEQLALLKNDTLTERRLRMAIWQQTDIQVWLDLLSKEVQEKQEWRYWRAKRWQTQNGVEKGRTTNTNEPNLADELWRQLATERGFYPMLAAYQLKQPYQPRFPVVSPLSDAQQAEFTTQFAAVAELRALGRLEMAKSEWIAALQAVNFDQKLAMASYALTQSWFDLSVEATIQAKAWDALPLRLPNAYTDWFRLHLAQSSISHTFAMAIARQESAWNPTARSHANAIGLMQLLPTTAAQTAKNILLPYSGERDLLEPFNNIMLGTAHLAELNQRYPNNRVLIAAAYNAGASRVDRWLARAGGRLTLDEFVASIPFLETRGYVQNVLAYDYFYQLLQAVPNLTLFSEEEVRQY